MKSTQKINGTLIPILGLCALGTLALATLAPAEAQTPVRVRTQQSVKLDASVMKKGHAAKKIGSIEIMERATIPPDDFKKITSQLPRPRTFTPAAQLTTPQKLDVARAVVPELSPAAKMERPFSIGFDGAGKTGQLTVLANYSQKEQVIATGHSGHITMPGQNGKVPINSLVELQFPTRDGYVYTIECGVARAGGPGAYKIDDYKNGTRLSSNGDAERLVFVHVGGRGAHYTIFYTGQQTWTFKGCTVTPING